MKAPVPRLMADLPPPPPGQCGWPWTEASAPLPERMADGSPWPRLSIITPSFNQGEFLEHALRSVLLQNYPNLEYIVVDGGSTDGSTDLLARYAPHLEVVQREPTTGHADALNRGLRAATGEIVAVLNSDDFFRPGAFAAAVTALRETKADLVHGTCVVVDQQGRDLLEHQGDVTSLDDILDFTHGWRKGREFLPQGVFWTRARHEKTGPFSTTLSGFAYEHWCRQLAGGAVFRRVDQPLASFRLHPRQRSQLVKDETHEEFVNWVEPWLWDRSKPLSAARRRALQVQWIHERKYTPAVFASRARGEGALRRWLGTLSLCLRYPVFFPELPTVKRLLGRHVSSPSGSERPNR